MIWLALLSAFASGCCAILTALSIEAGSYRVAALTGAVAVLNGAMAVAAVIA
jgi:hypothetical protein